jgi:hypothetical protein
MTDAAGGRPRDLGIEGYHDFVRIAEGGYSTVYRARQELFERDVAVKILSVQVIDEDAQRRFRRECSAAGRISDHPHVATILDAGFTAQGSPYIASEYCAKRSLADQLRSRGPFPVAEVLELGRKLAGGLQAVHDAGILHRDIKPPNILVSAYDEPKLADFGIALAEATITATGRNVITPYYTAPEVLGGRRATIAADVYALAASLYELLSGFPPYHRPELEGLLALLERIRAEPLPRPQRADLPDGVWALLQRALDPEPANRPRTAAAFGEELAALAAAAVPVAAGAPVAPTAAVGPLAEPAAAPTAPELPWSAPATANPRGPLVVVPASGSLLARVLRRPLALVVAAAVLVLAVVGVVALASGGLDEDDPETVVVEERDGRSSEEDEEPAAEASDGLPGVGPQEELALPDGPLASLLDLADALGEKRVTELDVQVVQDDTGQLQVPVPAGWEVITRAPVGVVGVAAGLSASPDLARFDALEGASGLDVVLFDGQPTDDRDAISAVTGALGLDDGCESSAGFVPLQVGAFVGTVELRTGCGEDDDVYVAAVVREPAGAYSAFVGGLVREGEDLAAVQAVLGAFTG